MMTFLVCGVATFVTTLFHVEHDWVIPLYGISMCTYGAFRGLAHGLSVNQ